MECGETSLLTLQVADDGFQTLTDALLRVVEYLFDQLMVGIQHHHERVGHLGVEAHAGLELTVFLHTAHILALRDDQRTVVYAHSLGLDGIVGFLPSRHL